MWGKEKIATGLHIAGISLFCSGLFCGYLITGLVSLTNDNWRIIVGLRLSLVILGGFWAGFAIGRLLEAPWRTTITCSLAVGLLGTAISINPFWDFLSGPTEIAGNLESHSVRRSTLDRPGNIAQPIINSALIIKNFDGQLIRLEPMGWQTNRIEKALGDCKQGSEVDGTILLHLDTMLQLQCHE